MTGEASNHASALGNKLEPLDRARQMLSGKGTNPDAPAIAQRSSSIGRTPPVTPPGRCGSPGSPYFTGSPHSRGSPHVKKIIAPASAVDDVMEKWGRPRAHSLSRRERERISLPAWKEEGDESITQPAPKLEDRRRAVSMTAAIPDAGADRTRAASMPEPWRPDRQRWHFEVRTRYGCHGMGFAFDED